MSCFVPHYEHVLIYNSLPFIAFPARTETGGQELVINLLTKRDALGYAGQRNSKTNFTILTLGFIMERTGTHKITITLKFELLLGGDEIYCSICGQPILKNQKMSIDHYIPRTHGGTDYRDNLFPAHQICNSIKGDLMPEDFEARKEQLFAHALTKWRLKKADVAIVARALANMHNK